MTSKLSGRMSRSLPKMLKPTNTFIPLFLALAGRLVWCTCLAAPDDKLPMQEVPLAAAVDQTATIFVGRLVEQGFADLLAGRTEFNEAVFEVVEPISGTATG